MHSLQHCAGGVIDAKSPMCIAGPTERAIRLRRAAFIRRAPCRGLASPILLPFIRSYSAFVASRSAWLARKPLTLFRSNIAQRRTELILELLERIAGHGNPTALYDRAVHFAGILHGQIEGLRGIIGVCPPEQSNLMIGQNEKSAQTDCDRRKGCAALSPPPFARG